MIPESFIRNKISNISITKGGRVMRSSKCLLAVIGLVLVSLFCYMGCETTPITSTQEVDSQVFTVSGLITNALSKEDSALANVTVQTINEGEVKEVETSSNGWYSINGLTPGYHKFTFSCSGFASVVVDSVKGDVDTSLVVINDVDLNVGLIPLDGSLSGKVYAVLGDSTSRIIAEGAEVQVWPIPTGITTFLKQCYTASVDSSDGTFSLNGLPRTNVMVAIPEWKNNDVAYNYSAVQINLNSISSIGAQDMTIRNDFIVKMVSTNIVRGYFDGDSISITFSDSINANTAMVALTGAANVNITTSWSSDGKTVTIKPVTQLAKGSINYTVSVVAKSGDGKQLTYNDNFTTSKLPYIVRSNVSDAEGNGKCCISRTDTIEITVSDSLSYVCVVDSARFDASLSDDGKTINIVPVVPITATMLNNLQLANGIMAIVGATGQNVNFTVPLFTLEADVNPFIVSSNVLDDDLTGLSNIAANTTITVMVSESLASVVPVAGFDATLSDDGKTISYAPTAGINLANITAANAIAGVSGDGEAFALTLPAFTLAAAPYVVSTNLIDANGNAMQDVGVSDTIQFVFSEAIDTTKNINVTWTVYGGQHITEVMGETLNVVPLQPFAAGGTPTISVTATSENGAAIAVAATNINVVQGIAIESSNLLTTNGAARFDFPVGDSIAITFTVPVDVSLMNQDPVGGGVINFITLTDANSGNAVEYSAEWSNDDQTVTITPTSNLQPRYQAAAGYTLGISASLPSIYPNNTLGAASNTTFFTTLGVGVPGAVSGFAFDTAGASGTYLPNGDIAAAGMKVRWNETDTVSNYYIYAKDANGTVWQQIATTAAVGIGQLYNRYTIPAASFDVFDHSAGAGDAVSFGNEIMVVVVAENPAGRGTSHSDTLIIADTHAPGDSVYDAAVASVTGDWNLGGTIPGANIGNNGFDNSFSTTPATMAYIVTFSEYMDIASEPSVDIDNTFATDDCSTPTWNWINRSSGYFLFTVPAGNNCSGATVEVDISGMNDSSGREVHSTTATENATGTQTLGI